MGQGSWNQPSEEFELTANTLQAHMKPHGKLILKPLSYLTMHSQDDLTAVTFLWVLHEFAAHTVSLLCDLFVRSTDELTIQW